MAPQILNAHPSLKEKKSTFKIYLAKSVRLQAMMLLNLSLPNMQKRPIAVYPIWVWKACFFETSHNLFLCQTWDFCRWLLQRHLAFKAFFRCGADSAAFFSLCPVEINIVRKSLKLILHAKKLWKCAYMELVGIGLTYLSKNWEHIF